MSRHLHIDASRGLAGDMMLAALVDLGGDLDAVADCLAPALPDLPVLRTETVQRAGIRALHLCLPEAASHGGPARHLADMLGVVEATCQPPRAAARAEAVFRALAGAEAAIHGRTAETVHFHEVSGIDTLIDVIGTVLLLEQLAVDSLSAGPVGVGDGTVACAHGTLPLPAPATAQLLQGRELHTISGAGERTTPTGAALLAALTPGSQALPPLRLDGTGWGAATRDTPGCCNAVRLLLGEQREVTGDASDTVEEWVCALDDCPGEVTGHLIGALLDTGALDAYVRPITMKKSRPGSEVVALAPLSLHDALAACLFRESTTFGVRVRPVTRLCLAREHHAVDVWGDTVRVKVGRWHGEVTTVAAEYEDCRALSARRRRPVRTIMQIAEAQAWAGLTAQANPAREQRETGEDHE